MSCLEFTIRPDRSPELHAAVLPWFRETWDENATEKTPLVIGVEDVEWDPRDGVTEFRFPDWPDLPKWMHREFCRLLDEENGEFLAGLHEDNSDEPCARVDRPILNRELL